MELNKNELKWLPTETKITLTLVYLEKISKLMGKINSMWGDDNEECKENKLCQKQQ